MEQTATNGIEELKGMLNGGMADVISGLKAEAEVYERKTLYALKATHKLVLAIARKVGISEADIKECLK